MNPVGRGDILENAQDVLPLFYLPAVESLSLSIHGPASPTRPVMLDWPTGQPPMVSKLRSLDLGCIREHHLEQLLLVTTGLKIFRWDLSHYDRFEEDHPFTSVIDLN